MIKPYILNLQNLIATDIQNGTFWTYLTDQYTHADYKHTELSNEDLIDRIFLDGKMRASSFPTEYDMRECVTEAILTDIVHIAETDALPYATYLRTVKLDDEIYNDPDDPVDFSTRNTGIALTSKGKLLQLNSDVTALVLRNDPDSRYGFKLVSAFPYLEAESAKETNFDITSSIENTKTYQKGKAIDIAFMRLAANDIPDNISIRKLSAHGAYPDTISVTFTLNNPLTVHTAYINRFNAVLRSYTLMEDETLKRIPISFEDKTVSQLDLTDETTISNLHKQIPQTITYITSAIETLETEIKREYLNKSLKTPSPLVHENEHEYEISL